MSDFTVFPAIDMREGRVVRLRQGDRKQETEYDPDPVAAADRWLEQGASWLHVVSLDGAFGENARGNMAALKRILAAANGHAALQFGGGLRDLASIDHLLNLGVARVVIGTAGVKNPTLLKSALKTFGPRRIVLGVDARDRQVQVSGWEEDTGCSPVNLVQRFVQDGLETVIYTNIRRDGMQSGADVAGTLELSQSTGLPVIASGGIGSLDDIRAVRAAGLPGVIVGKALYEETFTLKEALSC